MSEESKKTILIADDNDGIISSLTMVLEYGGYEVTSIMNGKEIKNMHAPFPDLILLDIWMTGINGFELCKYLKEREETKNIPVVMISAYPNSHDTALGAGANDFIEKPYTMEKMLTTVEKHLNMSRLNPVG